MFVIDKIGSRQQEKCSAFYKLYEQLNNLYFNFLEKDRTYYLLTHE
ncbi:hypothetical protein KL86DYS2_12565 [uncultured Dysgonomonas sp.]|uniref:Uncharacterized protein n=1 Tax=uncultured Dysgonomonas sp. TaxID=206096 RepID=A0A212JXR2_9BACT|nr:hypothetical protein KL86DYS2_12565 [uncultured Dysgonomonas sp.]